jgi:hypothetical protein
MFVTERSHVCVPFTNGLQSTDADQIVVRSARGAQRLSSPVGDVSGFWSTGCAARLRVGRRQPR